MKIMNLDIDDLFLMSTPKTVTSRAGLELDVLEISLGEKINSLIPNTILLGSTKVWQRLSDFKPYRSSFSLKKNGGSPLIKDEGVRTSSKESILFTGVYGKDCKTLLTEIELLLEHPYTLQDISVIAGGYMPLEAGSRALNLVLAVPYKSQYLVPEGGTVYNCSDDSITNDVRGRKITLAEIINK